MSCKNKEHNRHSQCPTLLAPQPSLRRTLESLGGERVKLLQRDVTRRRHQVHLERLLRAPVTVLGARAQGLTPLLGRPGRLFELHCVSGAAETGRQGVQQISEAG